LGTIIEIIKKPVICGIPIEIDLAALVGRRITGTREPGGYLIDGKELIKELKTIKGLTKEQVKMLKQQKIDRVKLFITLEYCEAVFQ